MAGLHNVVAEYVSGPAERLFTIEYRPQSAARGFVLFVPPFAGEMNRSRHMISHQARLLAADGYRVVVPDLRGTGDSYGEFRDATWEGWASDLVAVMHASGPGSNLPVIGVGIRLGALLALSAVRKHGLTLQSLVFWGPCLSGANFMSQFLRLRLMSSMIGKSEGGETLADLKASLDAGQSLEIAGYEVSADLYRAIAALELKQLMAGLDIPVSWFELVAADHSPLPMASANAIAALQSAGCKITSEAVAGPKFWSTIETARSDALAEQTLNSLRAA